MNLKTHKLGKALLALVLVLAMLGQTACNQAQFVAVIGEIGPAALDVLSIIAVVQGVPVNQAMVAKINADSAALVALYGDLSKAVTGQASIVAAINAGFNALNADLNDIFVLAQVKDPATQAKVTALIALIQTAVGIAEALIPQPAPPVAMKAEVKAKAKTQPMSVDQLVVAYNKVLVAKTGNPAVDEFTAHHQIHHHGSMLRHLSLGIAK